MGTFRDWTGRSLNLTAAAAGIILVVYIGFLLVANYQSQIELRKAIQEQFKQETDKRAAAVSYFYSERKKDLRDLQASREIVIFFQNMALGMSMEYGLRASLLDISGRFDRLLNDRTLDRDRIYTRIAFIDDNGVLLVDSRAPDVDPGPEIDWRELLSSEAREPVIMVDPRQKMVGGMISAAFFFKGGYSGQIVAFISPQTVYSHFAKSVGGPPGRFTSVISGSCSEFSPTDIREGEFADSLPLRSLEAGQILSFESKRRSGKMEQLLAGCMPVNDTPFSLFSVISASELFGRTAPWQLLSAMAALSLLVLGGAAMAWKINGRNLILQTRLEEEAKSKRGVEEKNRQLEREIADRRRAEGALRDSEEKYRAVVDNANEAIFIVQDGAIKFPNPSTSTITGYSADELAVIPFIDLVHSEDREDVVRGHINAISRENPVSTFAFRSLKKGGEELWLEAGSVLARWEGRPATLNFIRDITPQKRLELQLLHAHKMEAVGTLAGGIAHDFNNLLQVIQGYAELLLLDKGKDDPSYRELYEVFEAAKRGGELTTQLLTFSRKIESKPKPIALNRQIEQTKKLLARTIPKMIKIEINLAPDLEIIDADSAQIEQVLMNLAVNARDAMPEGGTLFVSTQNVVLPEGYDEGRVGVPPGEYVLLTVSDTGHGIEEKALEHIFEPFFSTKGVGRGTGLGLSMVYGIVESHGGYIICESEPGKGTTFKIFFPVIKRTELPVHQGAEEEITGGRETLLLVDDEVYIRDLCRQTLQRFGYKVITAENGEKALETFRENWRQIDVVLLDLIMPGISGKECLKEFLKIDPDVPIIVASGYSTDGHFKEILRAGARGFIRKPYEIRQMLKAIAETVQK